ncbi:MAG: GNAT family N-acetyltransferase [Rikenellaceae bacterium]
MKDIISQVDKDLIKQELTPERFIRKTHKANNVIYVVNAQNSPNTMLEIGRLREETFRMAGGGTGEPTDIDQEDMAEGGYEQLIVFDPQAEEIIGGYRFIISRNQNPKHMSTEHYFSFNDNFRKKYLPYTIELGRSFVQPHYQGTRTNSKGLYSLDNLWDGLGALMVTNPDMKYFLGKVTMYGSYDKQARNMLMYFMQKYFADNENLVESINPIELNIDTEAMKAIFVGNSFEENYKILSKQVRTLNENIPPLINSYINLSPTMKVFGTVTNPDFGEVEETGILITMSDIYPEKCERHTKDMLPPSKPLVVLR